MGFSIKAMWNNKCPRCRQGDIFVKPLKLSDPVNMPEKCAYCGQKTEPEPGFYFGAMFLSYIFSGWYILLPALLLVFYFKWSVNAAMVFVIFLGIISYLKILRGARSLWLHLMVKHEPVVEASVKASIDKERNKQWVPKNSA